MSFFEMLPSRSASKSEKAARMSCSKASSRCARAPMAMSRQNSGYVMPFCEAAPDSFMMSRTSPSVSSVPIVFIICFSSRVETMPSPSRSKIWKASR